GLRGHLANHYQVLVELQLAVLVGIEAGQRRRLVAGTPYQDQIAVFGRVERTILVGVDPIELRPQAVERQLLVACLPALAELLPRQHAVAVGIPALEDGIGRMRLGPNVGLLCHRRQRQRQQQTRQACRQPLHAPAPATFASAAGMADSKVIRSRISGVRRPIIIGLRTLCRKQTSNTSLMSPSKRIQLSTSPLTSEMIWTPHHGSASRLRSSSSRSRPSKR